ncbi:winged helix-turn-helix transcriptional regulator [Flavobacterium sp.]|uniref:winged helix-turn-helix transcriptional regulator n=1 Tax=Flavobacterium sp. TaxID=239 RepID=UPI003B9A2EF5
MVTKERVDQDFRCPVTALLELIGGKWKPLILFCLRDETRRFGELSARMPSISRKVLTEQLKQLESDGLVIRMQFNEIPPRVEYSLTDLGRSLAPVLQAMERWGSTHLSNPKH